MAFSIVLAVVLVACATVPEPQSVQPASQADLAVADEGTENASELSLQDWEIDFQRQRLLGDLLYDALVALEQDRLLSPIDDNAYARYQRVLAYDPDNQLALEGLQTILNRYLVLATEATRQGRFDDALSYLERARFVDQDDPTITEAWLVLQAEISTGDQVFRLDDNELAARSATIQRQLAEIAQQARQENAFFLITAPSDDQARWIFSVMRDAVEGYRLRGNIEIGAYAIVRLRKPQNE
ncbi:MAG: hypothetical protein WD772_02025, partial [Pseudohongiellaceae bacterium]